MTLTEVKAYLLEHRRASLGDIAVHFGSSPDAARQLLGHWLAKGRVRLLGGGGCASGCNCSKRPDEVYEWVGERVGTAPPAAKGGDITPSP